MKKKLLLTILFIGAVLLTGCSKNKSKVSIDEFYKKASSEEIQLHDYTSSYGYAKKAYETESKEYDVLFAEGNNKTDIHGIFFDEARNIYRKLGIDSNTTTEEPIAGELTTTAAYKKNINGGSGWETLEIITQDKYYYLAYVDDTYLYMEGNIDQKDKLIKLKDSINY